MSLLTIESLGDLGYEVATSAAEPFGRTLQAPLTEVPPLAQRLPTVLRTHAAAHADHVQVLAPIGVIERDGRVRRFASPR